MGQNADEFPQSAMLGDNAVRVEMDAQVLLGGINRAVFATADEMCIRDKATSTVRHNCAATCSS